MPDSLTDLAGLNVDAADFLAAALEAAGQPIWVVDPGDVIRFANPAALAVLGYDNAEELSGRHSHETIHYQHPDGTPYPAAECPMLLPSTTGEVVESDLDWFVRRDGSMFPVSYVSVPLEMPKGRGAVVAFVDIEERLRAEEVLREHDALLAAREAALRRIATLVAGGAASAEVFAAIATEVARVLGVPVVAVWRYESDGTGTILGAWTEPPNLFEVGTRWPLDGTMIATRVLETGRPAKVDDFTDVHGTFTDAVRDNLREAGLHSAAGAPIVVDGHVWGVMVAAGTNDKPLPDHIEDRLADFTELVATTISNSASREELARLADEQAALRRVATLVARGVSSADVFAAVAEEIGVLLRADAARAIQYVGEDEIVQLAGWSAPGYDPPPLGRIKLEGTSVTSEVLRTHRVVRIDDYASVNSVIPRPVQQLGIQSAVGAPIVVDGRLWGAMLAWSMHDQPLPNTAEASIADFTELVATALANAQARAEVERLADEQAALRRVATLVAREASPAEVFAAVAEELGRLLDAPATRLVRYEQNETATIVSSWGRLADEVPVGTRLPLGGVNVISLVAQTGRPSRIDDYAKATGPIAAYGRRLDARGAVGGPIVVAGELWGAMIVSSHRDEPLPPGTETWIEKFAELVGTAISNVETRLHLAASRTRIVMATDEARRRFERDLHDGAQQRLVSLALELQSAEVVTPENLGDLRARLSHVGEGLTGVLDDLRELSRGLHPAILSEGGLEPALRALARRSAVPVTSNVSIHDRLEEGIEVAAYYVVSEALTNAAKHARATEVHVDVVAQNGTLWLSIRDDGAGGANPRQGSGLVGLQDRVEALGGTLRVESAPDSGTSLRVMLPLEEPMLG
jgi:PAS domain S-box-containing protein